ERQGLHVGEGDEVVVGVAVGRVEPHLELLACLDEGHAGLEVDPLVPGRGVVVDDGGEGVAVLALGVDDGGAVGGEMDEEQATPVQRRRQVGGRRYVHLGGGGDEVATGIATGGMVVGLGGETVVLAGRPGQFEGVGPI